MYVPNGMAYAGYSCCFRLRAHHAPGSGGSSIPDGESFPELNLRGTMQASAKGVAGEEGRL